MLLLRFANDLEDYGRVESMPVLEGKRMTIMLAPKKAATPAPKKGAKEEAADASDETKSTVSHPSTSRIGWRQWSWVSMK